MLSSIISAVRVFKGLYDLAFSEDQFYVEQSSEFLGGIHHCVEQAREGWHNPTPARAYIRKPMKVVLGKLMLALFLATIVGGR